MANKPFRFQLQRTKGWAMPDNSMKVDRSTVFGTPFVADQNASQAKIVEMFTKWLAGDPYYLERFADMATQRHRLLCNLHRLKGKNLGCWCAEGAPCHADVLLMLANGAFSKIET